MGGDHEQESEGPITLLDILIGLALAGILMSIFLHGVPRERGKQPVPVLMEEEEVFTLPSDQ